MRLSAVKCGRGYDLGFLWEGISVKSWCLFSCGEFGECFRAGNGKRRVVLYEADSKIFNEVQVLPGGEEDCGEGADDPFGGVSTAEGFCFYQ